MRFVPVKSPQQQAALSRHRTRDLLIKQRPQLVNTMRCLLAEFGINIPQGLHRAFEMARSIVDGEAPDIPPEAVTIVWRLSQQALDTHAQCREIDLDLLAWQKTNDTARRLMSLPGIGTIGATALAESVTGPHHFRSGREFAARFGLTPRQHSSSGKERLGHINKMGDKIPSYAARRRYYLADQRRKAKATGRRSTACGAARAQANTRRDRRNG